MQVNVEAMQLLCGWPVCRFKRGAGGGHLILNVYEQESFNFLFLLYRPFFILDLQKFFLSIYLFDMPPFQYIDHLYKNRQISQNHLSQFAENKKADLHTKRSASHIITSY
jgi:hypothetical protein